MWIECFLGGDGLKIAVWNVERLKHYKRLDEIERLCARIEADIFVLTESDSRLVLDYPYRLHSRRLAEISPDLYRPTENLVSVYSKYPCVRRHTVFDNGSALCAELETERGPLLVYGTVMGIFGNRCREFKEVLPKQCADFARLCAAGLPLCVCGDFNISFSDNYYFTHWGRNMLRSAFEDNGIEVLTEALPQCIDHIALSRSFCAGADFTLQQWNGDKALSDHAGVAVDIRW